MSESDASDLKNQVSQLDTMFSDFHAERDKWDSLLWRETTTQLPEEISGSLQPIDSQSAGLEKATFDHVEVLRMNPTMFDANLQDPSETARKDERSILLTMARNWAHMDEDRWFDAAVGEGQVRYGFKAMQLRWRPQIESDADSEKDRDTEYRKRKWPFYFSDTNRAGCYFLEHAREIDAFYYKYEVPVVSSGITRSYEGSRQKLTLDTLGKVGWLGLDAAWDKETWTKKVKVLIQDARDPSGKTCSLPGCDHPLRQITVYVCGEGQEYENVDSYVSPFPGCSFLVVGGRISYNETNPHKRYRPLMLPMYQEQIWQNYLNTILATMSRTDYADEYVYIDLSKVPEWVRLPEGGEKTTYARPVPGSGEIPAYPGPLARWPKEISPHLVTLLSESKERLREYAPNRFVIGTAFSEASNATGTAFLQQAQQAALPYNGLLGQSDSAIKKTFEYCFHAIRFWAQSDAEGTTPTRYYAALTGDENVRRYGNTVKPGELVYIDADILGKYDFDIILKTESQTLAEEGARWLQAKDKYFTGAITFQQLQRDAGIFDITSNEEMLFEQKLRMVMEPMEMRLMEAYLLNRATALTGMDFASFMSGQVGGAAPGSPPPQSQPPTPGTGPQNNGMTGQGGNPTPTTAPNSLMGRSMQQATINGPSGGASPI